MIGRLGRGGLALAWLAALPGAAAAQDAHRADAPAPTGELRSFTDWVVGCDNFRRCTALGLAPEDGAGGYVAVRRGGGADAAPRVRLAALAEAAPADAPLAAAITGRPGPLLAATYPAGGEGSYRWAVVEGDAAAGLIEALRRGDRLELTLAAAEPALVSLAGSAAALRYMDAVQGRAGTVTALADVGDAPAAAVLPVPEPPAVPRLPMKALPTQDAPAGIAASGEASCAGVAPIAIALTDGSTLWGLCDFAAAYNTDYRFWIAGSDGVRPASFDMRGRAGDDPAVLTNPALLPDGLGLAALALGRGLGDCGVATDWAWTGRGFALLRLAEMDPCRSVPEDDWPVLFRAGD